MNMPKIVPHFLMTRSKRWLTLMAAGGFLLLATVLVVAQTRATPEKTSVATPVLSATTHASSFTYFTQERLQTYTGYDFDLYPDLTDFLDILEQQSVDAADDAATTVVQQLLQFVNPEYVQFEEYVIRTRENYWMIAKRRGYTIDTIVGCNPHLEKIVCYTGQKILLPSRGGCLHQVKPGESLHKIALDYRVDAAAIQAANVINLDLGVVPGMWLFVPGAKPLYLSQGMHKQYSKRSLFRSPLSGRYTSFVGKRIHPVLGFTKSHNGVDIACKMRSWVGASASGVVIAAGWGGAIGKHVKIDHQNGYVTMYGHLDAVYVKVGQRVRGGQLIARSGNTGRSTGPHLHYTIWEHGVIKNPMDFLW